MQDGIGSNIAFTGISNARLPDDRNGRIDPFLGTASASISLPRLKRTATQNSNGSAGYIVNGRSDGVTSATPTFARAPTHFGDKAGTVQSIDKSHIHLSTSQRTTTMMTGPKNGSYHHIVTQNATGNCGPQTNTIIYKDHNTTITQVTVSTPNCAGPLALLPYSQAASPVNPFISRITPTLATAVGSESLSRVQLPIAGATRVSGTAKETLFPVSTQMDDKPNTRHTPQQSIGPPLRGSEATSRIVPTANTILQAQAASAGSDSGDSEPTGSPLPIASQTSATDGSAIKQDGPANMAALASNIASDIAIPNAPHITGAEKSDIGIGTAAAISLSSPGPVQQETSSSGIDGPLPATLTVHKPDATALRTLGVSGGSPTSTLLIAVQAKPETGSMNNAATSELSSDVSEPSLSLVASGGQTNSAEFSTNKGGTSANVHVEKVVVTLGTQAYTAELFPIPSETLVMFGSSTIAPGGPAITIAGNTISAVSNGVVVDGDLRAISTFTVDEGGITSSSSAPPDTRTSTESTMLSANSASRLAIDSYERLCMGALVLVFAYT